MGILLGPRILGRLFDTVGRKPMIALTYILSGVLLVITGLFFVSGLLTAVTITACWVVIFFFASAGASSAYLTASEVFPMEIRANAIAYIYAVGTLVGGALTLHLRLVDPDPSRSERLLRLPGRPLPMILGGLTELFFGVDSERKSLEHVAAPLTALQVEHGAGPA